MELIGMTVRNGPVMITNMLVTPSGVRNQFKRIRISRVFFSIVSLYPTEWNAVLFLLLLREPSTSKKDYADVSRVDLNVFRNSTQLLYFASGRSDVSLIVSWWNKSRWLFFWRFGFLVNGKVSTTGCTPSPLLFQSAPVRYVCPSSGIRSRTGEVRVSWRSCVSVDEGIPIM